MVNISMPPPPVHLPELQARVVGEGFAPLTARGVDEANQSRQAAWSMSENASPSGLREPSMPTLSGSTTGASQPSGVKCGVFANAFDVGVDEEEEDCVSLDELEAAEDDDEDVDEGVNVVAAVPLAAKSNARVRSASGINFLLPVRSAR